MHVRLRGYHIGDAEFLRFLEIFGRAGYFVDRIHPHDGRGRQC